MFNKTFRIVNRKKSRLKPKPWFLNPINNRTIYIKEAKDSSLIQELVQFITLGINTDREKLEAIATFMKQNQFYDNKYSNCHTDFFELFSIKKRTL